MRQQFSVFDTHTHLGDALHSGRSVRADELLRSMDRCGVDRALAIPFPLVADYRAEHDLIAAAVRANPDRLCGAACIAPSIGEQAFRDELRRCVAELGLRALKLQPQFQPLNPLSRRNRFYFEAVAAAGVPLIVHTGAGAPYALPSLYIVPAREFPQLDIVLAHAGAGVYSGEAIVAASVCPNIYLELSSLTPHHMTEVFEHVAPSRLMIGSDLLEDMEPEISKVCVHPVDDEAKRAILWDTAAFLFGV